MIYFVTCDMHGVEHDHEFDTVADMIDAYTKGMLPDVYDVVVESYVDGEEVECDMFWDLIVYLDVDYD